MFPSTKPSKLTEIHTLDDVKEELYYQACYAMVCHDFPIDCPFIQALFDRLMEHGIYSDTFIDILYPDNHTSNTSELLLQALESIGYPMPDDKQQAINYMIQYHLQRIVEKKACIYDEIGELSAINYHDFTEHEFEIFGRAQPLCEEYVRCINQYPFNVERETAKENTALTEHLYNIARCCYLT